MTTLNRSCNEIVQNLKSMANPANVEGMARFGISSKNTLGVSVLMLRKMAKSIGRNHMLALELWSTEIHEARLLAGLIDEPAKVTREQMDAWTADFESWDICDQVCSNLFDKTPFAYDKAVEWSGRKEEFVKRAGFVLMAALALHDKKASDEKLAVFLPSILQESSDDRNFVRKAINWALRQIGKRNSNLRAQAIKTAQEMLSIDSKSAKWVAKDALRELQSKHLKANKNK